MEGRGGGAPLTHQAAPPTPDLGAKPFVNHQNILEQPTVQPVALSPAPSQDTVVSTASGFGTNRGHMEKREEDEKGASTIVIEDEAMKEPRGIKSTLNAEACFNLDHEVQEIEESRAIQEEAEERQRKKMARRTEPGAGAASSSGVNPPPGLPTPQPAPGASAHDHAGDRTKDLRVPANDLDTKMARMTENMELLLTRQFTQDHARAMVDTIWQKVQDQVEPIKTKQVELDKRVTVLEEKGDKKTNHATTQLVRLTDKHDPANKQVTVMWQVAQQSLDQKNAGN